MFGLVSALALTAGLANAIEVSGTTAWTCVEPSVFGSTTSVQAYCGTTITSGTTTTQLGSINIDPRRQVYVAATASAAAVSGLVTPTLIFNLGGVTVSTQTISATTTGNLLTLPAIPFFDNVVVSFTNPATISATNSVRMTVIEGRR